MQKWRVATHQHNWYDVVDALVYNYNNTKHRTLKETPENVYQGNGISQQIIKEVPHEIEEYDIVRVKEKKKVSIKVMHQNFQMSAIWLQERKEQNISLKIWIRMSH